MKNCRRLKWMVPYKIGQSILPNWAGLAVLCSRQIPTFSFPGLEPFIRGENYRDPSPHIFFVFSWCVLLLICYVKTYLNRYVGKMENQSRRHNNGICFNKFFNWPNHIVKSDVRNPNLCEIIKPD